MALIAFHVFQGGPEKKLHKLPSSLVQVFNIKLKGFHQNVRGVQKNKDQVATFM